MWIVLLFLAAAILPGVVFREGLNVFFRRRGAVWALSASVTALFFLCAAMTTVMRYMTNDDVFFLKAAASVPAEGFSAVLNTLANSAQEHTESMSVFLCAFIGLFYGIDPGFPWYLGYHLAVLFASLTVIGRCVLVSARRRGLPVWAGCLIHAALCLGVFFYSLVVLAFTVTAAVAGTAAVALMLCGDGDETTAGRAASAAGSGLLMLLCLMQRLATGECLACFWALAAGYRLWRLLASGEARRKRRAAALAGGVLATTAVLISVNAAGAAQSDPAYHEAEYYRSLVVDYLNDALTYEQYESAGVPRELATLIHGWYFMDERVTTDLFREVTDLYYAQEAAATQPPPGERLAALLGGLAQTLGRDGQTLCRAGLAGALFLVCAAAFIRRGRRYLPEFTAAVCTLGGAALLLLYLMRGGRFPLRVFLVIIYPAITALLLLALRGPTGPPPESSAGRRRAALALAALGGAAACVFAGMGVYLTPGLAQPTDRETLFADQWTIEEYAMARPDKLFVTNLYDWDLDPLHGTDYPRNIRLWGAAGDTYHTDERLYADVFFEENTRFLCQNPGYITYLLQYLTLDHGPVAAEAEAYPAKDVCVYRLTRIAPGEDYTGWYEYGGLRYYFEHGRPVGGTRVIDGEICEFAPAGADAALTTLDTGGGVVYVTTAYSLRDTSPRGTEGTFP